MRCDNIGFTSNDALWRQIQSSGKSPYIQSFFLFESKIFDVAAKCDALVCSDDYNALIVVRLLMTAGFRVPEDIAVISFDNSVYCDMSPIPLTSLDGKHKEIGRKAAAKLLNMISGIPESSEMLSWELVKRESS